MTLPTKIHLTDDHSLDVKNLNDQLHETRGVLATFIAWLHNDLGRDRCTDLLDLLYGDNAETAGSEDNDDSAECLVVKKGEN